jgi:hypothetical protein
LPPFTHLNSLWFLHRIANLFNSRLHVGVVGFFRELDTYRSSDEKMARNWLSPFRQTI